MPGMVTTPLPEFAAQTYSQSLESKQARFHLYDFMLEQIDRTQLAVETLEAIGKLPVEATIIDVGSDSNPVLSDLEAEVLHPELFGASSTIHPYEGRIARLDGVEDDSADVVFCMDTLHHAPQQTRQAGFSDISRALAPEGVFTFTVSAGRNKYVHRELESYIARALGIAPPQPETGFTAERAETELPRYFDHVYLHQHISALQIGPEGVEEYMTSLRTLRDQFTPTPDPLAFETALQEAAAPIIQTKINNDGFVIDYAYLVTGLASDKPLQLPKDSGFIPVTKDRS